MRSVMEEMSELRKLRTAVMVEKCLVRNEGIVCPKPTRWARSSFHSQLSISDSRSCGVHNELRVTDLSDIIPSKASPPYYSVSPPVRVMNPQTRDAHFRKQRASQLPAGENCDNITHSILTMA